MRRFTGMIASAAVVLSVVTGCGGTTSPQPVATGATGATGAPGTPAPAAKKAVTLMLNWIPYGEHAPFYYGLEKGYFSDEGIDLTIQPGGGSGKTVQAVGGKQVTFGWADGPALINGISNGIPVKSVGSFLQVGPGSVEFFADKNFKTPADLKGKTIAMTAGDAVSQTFGAFLAANNMTIKDVNVVNIDPTGKLAALQAGKVDAILGFFHDQAPTIANTDTLKNDPELVKAFLR
ncbi:MAG: sulfonate transporter substrate-binding protein, partial [Firmicutes bacterium]|nr:sulfonate transporter substrate-binding protein [Bacillota bacterium]